MRSEFYEEISYFSVTSTKLPPIFVNYSIEPRKTGNNNQIINNNLPHYFENNVVNTKKIHKAK